jgi:hypothetical protein
VVGRVSKALSITAGAGYRIASFDQRHDSNLRGATGTLAVRFEF